MAVFDPNVRASSTSNTAVRRPSAALVGFSARSRMHFLLLCARLWFSISSSAKRRTSWEIADEALSERDNVRNWRPFGVRSEPLACVQSGAENNQPTVSMQSEVQSLFGSEGKFLVLVDAR
jgi:hypothetical protein